MCHTFYFTRAILYTSHRSRELDCTCIESFKYDCVVDFEVHLIELSILSDEFRCSSLDCKLLLRSLLVQGLSWLDYTPESPLLPCSALLRVSGYDMADCFRKVCVRNHGYVYRDLWDCLYYKFIKATLPERDEKSSYPYYTLLDFKICL